MDDDAATLLARTPATLVRQLSEIAGHHFEGFQTAARYKSLNLTNRHRRQLCHLDIAFNWSRHVTSVKCATLTAKIKKHVLPAPAATCAATATLAPVTEYVAPTPTVFHAATAPMIDYVTPAPADAYAAPARVIEYVAPAPMIKFFAPPPAATCFSPCQQLPPNTMATVTTDARSDTGFVNPQFSTLTSHWFASPLG